jgi:pseudouridine synthase
MEERINKYLARATGTSRREAEQLIRERRVMLNGKVLRELAVRVDPQKDHVKIDGKLVSRPTAMVYLVYNKPRKVVCTMEDPEGRPCVGDLLKKIKGRPLSAGRLDFDAEGLLLCTNDGDLIERLLHPRYHVRRVYHVKVRGVLHAEDLKEIREGIVLDGKKTLPAYIHILKHGKKNSWLSLTIYEGRNQQVKRMLERVGHPVLKLKRIAFGPLSVEGIPPGEYRKLHPEEVLRLKEHLQGIDKSKRYF